MTSSAPQSAASTAVAASSAAVSASIATPSPPSPPSPATPATPATPGASFWWLLGSLYVSQYLGIAFFVVALVAILRGGGASLDQISLIYLLGMAGALKFLWAPLVDRFSITRFGHYRSWLILLQSALIVVLLSMAGRDPLQEFWVVYALCLVVSTLGMTQDIAVDALACRTVPEDRRGLANGLQAAGGLISFMLGGGLVLALYPTLGWSGSMVLLALGHVPSLIQLLFFREAGRAVAIASGPRLLGRIWTFWRRPGGGRWLLMMTLSPTAVSLAYALMTPALVDAGWTIDRIGIVVNVIGSIAGALAALATGRAVRTLGRQRALKLAAICQVPAVLAVALIVAGATSWLPVALAAIVYFACYNPTWVVLATLMMDRVDPETAGTDYSVQWSVFMAVQMTISGLAMVLADRLGYAGVLWIALTCAALSCVAAWRFRA